MMNLNEIVDNILQLQYQMLRTQKMLESFVNQNRLASELLGTQLKNIEEYCIEQMQKKFPQLNLQFNKSKKEEKAPDPVEPDAA